MKKILVLFGILDLISVIHSLKLIATIIEKGAHLYWPNLLVIPLYGSLIVSGILLIKANRTGIWIYYAQFPFRLMFYAGLSLGFLYPICNLFCDIKTINTLLVTICSIFEILRLIVTILIHKKFFGTKSNSKIYSITDLID